MLWQSRGHQAGQQAIGAAGNEQHPAGGRDEARPLPHRHHPAPARNMLRLIVKDVSLYLCGCCCPQPTSLPINAYDMPV